MGQTNAMLNHAVNLTVRLAAATPTADQIRALFEAVGTVMAIKQGS
jgi:hypothetical protein